MVKSANDVAATDRGKSRRLGRGLRRADEPRRPRAWECATAISPIRTACRTSATRRPPATWRSWPGRLMHEFPDYQELFRIGADPIRPPDHAQHEWPDRPLSGRRRHEDRLHLLGGIQRRGQRDPQRSASDHGGDGAPSANERTMKAAELFDRGFSSQPTWSSPLSPHCRPRPRPRLRICARLSATVAVPCPMRKIAPPPWRRSRRRRPESVFIRHAGLRGRAPSLCARARPALGGAARARVGRLEPAFRERVAAEAAKEAAAAAKAREAKSQKAKSKNAKGKVDADTVAETDDKPEVDKVESKGKARATISVKPVTDKAKAPADEAGGRQGPAKDASKPADPLRSRNRQQNRRSGEGQAGGELSRARDDRHHLSACNSTGSGRTV